MYIHACFYICWICTYIYIYKYIMFIDINRYIYIYIYTYVCIYIHIHIWIDLFLSLSLSIYICIHLYYVIGERDIRRLRLDVCIHSSTYAHPVFRAYVLASRVDSASEPTYHRTEWLRRLYADQEQWIWRPGIEPGTIWLLQISTVRCSANWAIARMTCSSWRARTMPTDDVPA